MKTTTNAFAGFEQYALTAEEARMVKGGSWACHYYSVSGAYVTSTGYSNAETALANCSGNVGRDGVYCAGCEENGAVQEPKSTLNP